MALLKEAELGLAARTGLFKCRFPSSICGIMWNVQYLDVITRWCQEPALSCLHLPGQETHPNPKPVGGDVGRLLGDLGPTCMIWKTIELASGSGVT